MCRVLAEAEERDTSGNDSSRASDLLASFSNVSEFRYEAPKLKDEDKVTWDAAVPIEERLKFNEKKTKGEQKTSTKVSVSTRSGNATGRPARKSSSRMKRTRSAYDDELGPASEEEEESSDTPVAPAPIPVRERGKKKSTLTEKESYRLTRAMLKFGHPEIRIGDVKTEARLLRCDSATILANARRLLEMCRTQLKNSDAVSESKRKSRVVLDLGRGYACDCEELLDRVECLRHLNDEITDQNKKTLRRTIPLWQLKTPSISLVLPSET